MKLPPDPHTHLILEQPLPDETGMLVNFVFHS